MGSLQQNSFSTPNQSFAKPIRFQDDEQSCGNFSVDKMWLSYHLIACRLLHCLPSSPLSKAVSYQQRTSAHMPQLTMHTLVRCLRLYLGFQKILSFYFQTVNHAVATPVVHAGPAAKIIAAPSPYASPFASPYIAAPFASSPYVAASPYSSLPYSSPYAYNPYAYSNYFL